MPYSKYDRPVQRTRRTIDVVLGRLHFIRRRRAARALLAAGVPLPVIARVITEPSRRRPPGT